MEAHEELALSPGPGNEANAECETIQTSLSILLWSPRRPRTRLAHSGAVPGK